MADSAQYNPYSYTPSQLWCLGLGAIQQSQNGDEQDAVGYEQASEARITVVAKALERDWEVSDKKSLMETLDWLRQAGHNRSYLMHQRRLEQMSVSGIKAFIDSIADESEANKLRVVANYRHVLARGGVAAWDVGRYVWVVRSARTVGWLDDSEMWSLLANVAQTTQPLFRSWYDYGVSYFAGRQYWRGVVTADSAERESVTLRGVTGNSRSAWNKLDWSTPLEFS